MPEFPFAMSVYVTWLEGCLPSISFLDEQKVLERSPKGTRKVPERYPKGARKGPKGVRKVSPRRPQGPFDDLGGNFRRSTPRVGRFVLTRNFGGLLPMSMSLHTKNFNFQPHLPKGYQKHPQGGPFRACPFWTHHTG